MRKLSRQIKENQFQKPTRQEIESALAAVEFGRKPMNWNEVDTVEPSVGLTLVVDSLPRFEEQEILPKGLEGRFKGEMPQYFLIIGNDKHTYLVDTQGYDYARYVARIK
jgi:hypothetical protein